jgi:superfamily II DNA or RNA helicase
VSALWQHQQEGLDALECSLSQGKRPLLAIPVGGGKTKPAAVLAKRRVDAGGRVLWLTHREELKDQALAELAREGIAAGVLKAAQRDYDAKVIVASVQTASRPEHLERLGKDFSLVVVDEAHHATADSWRAVLDALKDVPRVGLTATPYRDDGTPLTDVFDEVAYARTITSLIPEYLSDIRRHRVQVRADFNRLHVRAGEIQVGEAGEMLMNADAPAEIAKSYVKYASGRKALVFTPTIEVAEAVAKALVRNGVAAEAVSNECAPEERRGAVARLRSGETSVLVNCTLFTEGFDVPDVSCIVIARPTKSKVLYVQMIGRGMRKSLGKEDCLVLDLTGATERHDLFSIDSLFGVDLRPGESLTEGLMRRDVERVAATLAEEERGQLVASAIEVVRAHKLHWAAAPDGALFVLSFGADHGSLIVRKAYDGTWTVTRRMGKAHYYVTKVIARGVDLPTATLTAEGQVPMQSRALVEVGAKWRKEPATPSQLQTAAKNRVKVGKGATRGQVSDALALVFARKNA